MRIRSSRTNRSYDFMGVWNIKQSKPIHSGNPRKEPRQAEDHRRDIHTPKQNEMRGGGEPSVYTGHLVLPWHSAPVGDPHVVPRVVPLVPDARGMAVRVRRARLRAREGPGDDLERSEAYPWPDRQ